MVYFMFGMQLHMTLYIVSVEYCFEFLCFISLSIILRKILDCKRCSILCARPGLTGHVHIGDEDIKWVGFRQWL